ncbi:MAG: sulfotransferase [Pseudomonadota bacterium]
MNLIFITGRFCSGTTFLWNFFNSSKYYHAYYEPLHPGLLASIQHIAPKKSHQGVDDYWQAYTSLPELEKFYSPTFGFERLVLQADEPHNSLKNYIHYLSQNGDNKQVAIKFNRIDFRLPWIKKNFPQAKIIHIKRNPRDSWKSSRAHLPDEVAKDMFQFNAYELTQWVIALDENFPFIIDNSTSSYHLHYFLAKLSEKFALQNADETISFEEDITKNFDGFIQKITDTTGLNKKDVTDYASKRIVPELKQYSAEEIAWLESVEKECDEILNKQDITKPSALINSDKRKLFMQNLLKNHYQLENKLILSQGALNKAREANAPKSLFSRIKKKFLTV